MNCGVIASAERLDYTDGMTRSPTSADANE